MYPLISIITVSYNQHLFIERCIKSVLAQSYKNIEYIIIDNLSDDGTAEILEKYRTSVFTVLSERDNGPVDGLRKGIGLSRGDFFIVLNSDDELMPFAVHDVVTFLRAHPHADVISGHGFLADPDGRFLRRVFSEPFSPYAAAAGAGGLMHPATLVRRSTYELTGGFNLANKIAWDFELWFDIARMGGKFEILPSFQAIYRIHKNSITSSALLSAKLHEYRDLMFLKTFSRTPSWGDRILQYLFRIRRYLRNPRAFAEGLFYGTIADNALPIQWHTSSVDPVSDSD